MNYDNNRAQIPAAGDGERHTLIHDAEQKTFEAVAAKTNPTASKRNISL